MDYRACIRCGGMDLATPGVQDGIFPEGGELMAWVCRTCGHQGAPVVFSSREEYLKFREERAVLYKPEAPSPFRADSLPTALDDDAQPRRRRAWTRGIGAVMGFVFLTAALLIFVTAARVGGNAWFTLAPSGIVALLLGLPFAAMAARR